MLNCLPHTVQQWKCKKYEKRFTCKNTLFRRDFQTLNARAARAVNIMAIHVKEAQKQSFTLQCHINVYQVGMSRKSISIVPHTSPKGANFWQRNWYFTVTWKQESLSTLIRVSFFLLDNLLTLKHYAIKPVSVCHVKSNLLWNFEILYYCKLNKILILK